MEKIIKSIVITGASSGIGFTTCAMFLDNGYYVFGSVRKKSDALKLKKEFGERFEPLIFDVNKKSEIIKSVAIIQKRVGKNNLTALVNNAGIAVLGPLEYLNTTDFRQQLETNLIGTLNCTQALLPLLGSQRKDNQPKGRIINISSALGGKIGYPFYGAYCSSKHALEGLSEALRRELTVHGINVSIIAPGAIQTPIWQKAESASLDKKYQHTAYSKAFEKMLFDMKELGKTGLKPETVSQKILKAVEDKNPKIRYTFISELTLNLVYFAPRGLMDWVVTRYLGLRRILNK